jgi:hypothetical protein
MQYHVEIESDTVDNWGAVPVYAEALRSALGEGALDSMKAETNANINECMRCARTIYQNFMNAIE